MTSIIRRASAKLLKLLERAVDPGAFANQVSVYAKDVGGTSQLFAQTDDGTVNQLTPVLGFGRYALPEGWTQNDIPAAQAATPLGGLNSTLFDDIQQIGAGSIVGMNVRFSAALAVGEAIARVTINGVPGTLTVQVQAPNQSDRNRQAAGIDTFVGGDLIGVMLATDAGFLPAGSNDVEVWLEVDTGP